eukprot:12921964-Prorocentrum_lima.AAC.1
MQQSLRAHPEPLSQLESAEAVRRGCNHIERERGKSLPVGQDDLFFFLGGGLGNLTMHRNIGHAEPILSGSYRRKKR